MLCSEDLPNYFLSSGALLPLSTLLRYATALRYRNTNETTKPSDRSEKIKTIAQESDENIERNGNERVRERLLRSLTADSTRCARTIHKFKCERVRLHAVVVVVVWGTKKFVCSIAAYKKTKQKISIVKKETGERWKE